MELQSNGGWCALISQCWFFQPTRSSRGLCWARRDWRTVSWKISAAAVLLRLGFWFGHALSQAWVHRAVAQCWRNHTTRISINRSSGRLSHQADLNWGMPSRVWFWRRTWKQHALSWARQWAIGRPKASCCAKNLNEKESTNHIIPLFGWSFSLHVYIMRYSQWWPNLEVSVKSFAFWDPNCEAYWWVMTIPTHCSCDFLVTLWGTHHAYVQVQN